MPNNNFNLLTTVTRDPNQTISLLAVFTFGTPTPAICLEVTSPTYLIGKYIGRVYGFSYVNLGSKPNIATLFAMGALVYPQTMFNFNVPTETASNGGLFIGWGSQTENVILNVYQSP